MKPLMGFKEKTRENSRSTRNWELNEILADNAITIFGNPRVSRACLGFGSGKATAIPRNVG